MYILGASKEECKAFEQRKEELRGSKAEVFVSVIDEKLTSLNPTNKEDLLLMLRKELRSQGYPEEQYAIIKKWCESLESGH